MKKKLQNLSKSIDFFLNSQPEGTCPFCGAQDYPVKGRKRGYENVNAEDAEEWNIDHEKNCLISVIETAQLKIESHSIELDRLIKKERK
jgi:hypothetical protein